MTYKVTVEPGHHEFFMDADETLLHAALQRGHRLPYSCRGGTCGACMGRVLRGVIAYDGLPPPGINAEEMAEGKALLCQAYPRSDVVIEVREITAVRDIPVKTLPCRVIGMQALAADVMRLYLKLPAIEDFRFLAGQYIDIILRDGRRRSYSLANAPHADDYLELHVRYVPGGAFSDFVFKDMREKTILRLQGPLGSFFLREDSQRSIIMIAGGTGFAPLKSMLEHAFHSGSTRPIHFYWGARARHDLYLNELPEVWAEQYPFFHYTPVLSEPLPEDHWQGRSGWVHAAVAADYPDLSAYEVYMSGPPAMIQAGKTAFAAQGLALEQLYCDAFEYAAD